ncbi:MAG: transposase IS1634 family protein, partial [Leptospirillum sp. Group IV 'UBA BS']
KEVQSPEKTVEAYKSLSQVERAFRSLKTVDLEIRPIYHRLSDRVKAHVFLCMLAYYVEWQMKQKLQPLLFAEEDREGAARERKDIVRPAVPSKKAQKKGRLPQTRRGSARSELRRTDRGSGNACQKRHAGGEGRLGTLCPADHEHASSTESIGTTGSFPEYLRVL